ncbi:MAG: hypothetical protein WBC91_03750 [Phototrophicaceae bacterium]
MNKRVIWTLILLLIAASGLVVGYLTWSAQNASLDLTTTVISEADFINQSADIVPFGAPPANLMFSSDASGDWDVMLLDSAGTLNNLTGDDSGGQDIFSSFSISGDTINFVANRTDPMALGPAQVKPDGTELRTLTVISAVMTLVSESQFDWDPAWSPDGETLAWVSLRDANLEIYTLPLSGDIDISNADRRTRDVTRDWYVAWSPNGAQLAYNNNAGGTENVYLFDVATDEITQLTDDTVDLMHPFWSLDGETLYYIRESDAMYTDGVFDIVQMNPDGSNPQALDGIVRADPVWSQGSSHIAFMSNVEGNWHIYVSRADGTNLRRVTEGDANHMFPVWMP